MKEPPTFADRMNRREEMMKSRLESMEAVKPTLLALYDKLTPEQKAVFDRPMMGRHGHGGPGRHGRRG
jgi:Spy/CpxP family protein refolding chaperone